MTRSRHHFALRSLGTASDLAALGPEAVIESHPDRIVVRMPGLPDFWSGNCVVFRRPEVDPTAQVARFRVDFPRARHVALTWDDPQVRLGPGHDVLIAAGFDVEVEDVLMRSEAAPPAPAPAGVTFRALRSDADWTAATSLQIETGLEQGYDAAPHGSFVEHRMAMRRRHAEDGGLRWFGAFDADALVVDLGVVVTPCLARFQSVETRASHRRRGIAAALVCHASGWAGRAAPGAPQVILADAEAAAGRLYRRLGFAVIGRIASATRGSYARGGSGMNRAST